MGARKVCGKFGVDSTLGKRGSHAEKSTTSTIVVGEIRKISSHAKQRLQEKLVSAEERKKEIVADLYAARETECSDEMCACTDLILSLSQVEDEVRSLKAELQCSIIEEMEDRFYLFRIEEEEESGLSYEILTIRNVHDYVECDDFLCMSSECELAKMISQQGAEIGKTYPLRNIKYILLEHSTSLHLLLQVKRTCEELAQKGMQQVIDPDSDNTYYLLEVVRDHEGFMDLGEKIIATVGSSACEEIVGISEKTKLAARLQDPKVGRDYITDSKSVIYRLLDYGSNPQDLGAKSPFTTIK